MLVHSVVIDLYDARMSQLGESVVFALEQPLYLLVLGVSFEQALERHALAGRFVQDLINRTHAPRCNKPLDVVTASNPFMYARLHAVNFPHLTLLRIQYFAHLA